MFVVPRAAALAVLAVLLTAASAHAEDRLVDAPGGTDCPGAGEFATIGDAVTAAVAGDRILVCAGTYRESVDVTKPLTFLGARAGEDARERDPVNESVVDVPFDAAADAGFRLRADADGTVIDGFTVRDGKSSAAGGNNRGILTTDDTDDVVIRNTILRNNSYAIQQFNFSDRMLIERNLFIANNNVVEENNEGFHGVFGGAPGLVVQDNDFRDHSLAAINLPGPASDITVRRNTSFSDGNFLITADAKTNVLVQDNVVDRASSTAMFLSAVDGLTVEGNEITAGPSNGVLLSGQFGGPSTNVVIRGNSITGRTRGVSVASNDGADGTTTIAFNRFAGNSAAASPGFSGDAGAITNFDDDVTIDARNNWFGCNEGPGAAGCDAIGGDAADAIDASPHLVMSLGASPTGILAGGEQSLVTADFTRNSDGATPAGNVFPEGLPVDFDTDLGLIDEEASTDETRSASATLTSGEDAGTADVQAAFDAETVTTQVEIEERPPVVETRTETVTQTQRVEVPGPVQGGGASQAPVFRRRVAPRALEFTTTRRGRRFTTRGRVVLPPGVTPAQACGDGFVTIQVKRGPRGRTLSNRRAVVGPDCTFRSNVTFNRAASLRGISRVRFTVRFFGNGALRQFDGPTRSVPVR